MSEQPQPRARACVDTDVLPKIPQDRCILFHDGRGKIYLPATLGLLKPKDSVFEGGICNRPNLTSVYSFLRESVCMVPANAVVAQRLEQEEHLVPANWVPKSEHTYSSVFFLGTVFTTINLGKKRDRGAGTRVYRAVYVPAVGFWMFDHTRSLNYKIQPEDSFAVVAPYDATIPPEFAGSWELSVIGAP